MKILNREIRGKREKDLEGIESRIERGLLELRGVVG